MTAEPAAEQIYRLRSGVARVMRSNATILVAPVDGRSLRISPIGEELLPLLADGATLPDFERHLRDRHPTARDIGPKLRRFLDQLSGSGLLALDTHLAPRRDGFTRLPMFDVDPAARMAARLLGMAPAWCGWVLALAIVAAALGGLLALALDHLLPDPRRLVERFDILALAMIAAMIPLHEFSHALTCRLVGIPVGRAGLVFHGSFIPSPYVDTSQAYRLQSRRQRAWIPAAGLLMDCAAVAAAAWAIELELARQDACRLVLCVGLGVLLVNLNPFTASDGSRVIEAALGDDLARRSALSRRVSRLSHPRDTAIYRIACSMYVQAILLLAFAWWMANA